MSELKEELVTISEAARQSGVSRQTIHKWIKLEKVIPVRVFGLPYVSLADVKRLKQPS